MKRGLFRLFITTTGVVLGITSNVMALNKDLARTPPIGFSTWNWWHCDSATGHGSVMNETAIHALADAMVSSGMKDSGYTYLNLDDCWPEKNRNSDGGMIGNRRGFPNGIKPIADYVHSKGLKFGLYSAFGPTTCDGWPGMMGHEAQDVDSFLVWGVDYLKVDLCTYAFGTTGPQVEPQYVKIRDALKNEVAKMKSKVPTAHEIVYSLCLGPTGNSWEWGDTVGNLWRTTKDIDYPDNPPAGTCNGLPCWAGILFNLDHNEPLAKYAGPNKGWNDPDMLEVGNYPVNTAQSRAHFSLWCMMASPLMAGNDLRSMSDTIKKILTNGEAIRVDQDSLGLQGVRVTSGNMEVWVRKLSSMTSVKTDTNYAILFFNRNNGSNASITATQIANAVGGGITAGKIYTVRDLWNHKDLGEWTAGTYTPTGPIPNNDVFMIRLSPKSVVSTMNSLQAAGPNVFQVKGENITVKAPKLSSVSVTMFDLKGAVVYSQRYVGPVDYAIGTTGMRKGLYVIALQSENESYVRRVLLK